MEKLSSQVHKGIHYIKLADLSKGQREAFEKWLDKEHIISIMIENSIVKDCVQFNEYDYWFESVYSKKKSPTSVKKISPNRIGMSFNNTSTENA